MCQTSGVEHISKFLARHGIIVMLLHMWKSFGFEQFQVFPILFDRDILMRKN